MDLQNAKASSIEQVERRYGRWARTGNGREIDEEQICDGEIRCLAGKGRYKQTETGKRHVCQSGEPIGVNLPA